MASHSAEVGQNERAFVLLERRLARSTLFADSDPHVHVVLSTANPAAYGDFGLGLTLALQMLPYIGLVDADAKNIMYGFALFFGGLGQLVCGCLEYSRKNVFACVTWLCFSGYWLGTGLIGILEAAEVLKPSPTGAAAASALWAFLAFLLWTCTFGTNLALSLLLLMVTILLCLEAACPSHPHLYRATGIFGIATAAIAFYLGTASLYVEMYGREILPVFPLSWSKMPLSRRRGPMTTRRELLALVPETALAGDGDGFNASASAYAKV